MRYTDNKIYESYKQSRVQTEKLSDVGSETAGGYTPYTRTGAAAAAPAEPSADPYSRASVAIQKFVAGQGGGISKVFGKIGSYFGSTYDRYKANFAQEETANFLWKKFQGILVRHNMVITVRQVKDVLSKIKLTSGGAAIMPNDLKVWGEKGLGDDDTVDEIKLKDILRYASAELQEIVASGKSTVPMHELLGKLSTLPADEAATFLTVMTEKGLFPPA